MKDFLKKIKHLFFPGFGCLVCNREIRDLNKKLCDDCLNNINEITGNICLKCGAEIPAPSTICDKCKTVKLDFDQARAVYFYNDYSSKLVLGLKYKNHQYVVPYLAQKLGKVLKDWGINIDIIIPVPLTEKRERDRGFNQSLLLAEALNKEMKETHEVRNDFVFRTKDVKPQSSLKMKERLTNLDGVFKINKNASIEGKNILIIDDVITTGTTVNEISKQLRKLKPQKIYVLTVLKTLLERKEH